MANIKLDICYGFIAHVSRINFNHHFLCLSKHARFIISIHFFAPKYDEKFYSSLSSHSPFQNFSFFLNRLYTMGTT
jgi:hypothetical protein